MHVAPVHREFNDSSVVLCGAVTEASVGPRLCGVVQCGVAMSAEPSVS